MALERELQVAERVIPAAQVKQLQKVLIWVEWDQHLTMANGREGGAVAVFNGGHQADMLREGKHPDKANAVTILSMKALAAEHQPKGDSNRCVTLHELAHAYHHFVADDGLAKTTFTQALERKLYDPKMYAATNRHEYFAELTCAYLDSLHYYPRTADDLKKHDPKGYELMEKSWGKKAAGKKDPKAPAKPPSADGDGKYPLDVALAEVAFGKPAGAAQAVKPDDFKGKPAFLTYHQPGNASSASGLTKVRPWLDELRDFGLVGVGVLPVNSDDDPPAGDGLTWVRGAKPGQQAVGQLPHAIVFDHDGRCVFRGSTFDAEPFARAAVGRAAVAAAGRAEFAKSVRPLVEALEKGQAPSAALPKLTAALSAATAAEAKEQIKALTEALTAGGRKALVEAEARADGNPVSAFLEAERLPTAYRGTDVATKAAALLAKLRSKPAVAAELKARPALERLKAIDLQLTGQEGSFNPRLPAFQDENAGLLRQLSEGATAMKKPHGSTQTYQEALELAAKWGVRQNVKE